MALVLGFVAGVSFGWFVGVVFVTAKLRRKVGDLDAERSQLDRDLERFGEMRKELACDASRPARAAGMVSAAARSAELRPAGPHARKITWLS